MENENTKAYNIGVNSFNKFEFLKMIFMYSYANSIDNSEYDDIEKFLTLYVESKPTIQKQVLIGMISLISKVLVEDPGKPDE